nr:MAG TPA_asm: hypothetical protein [Caudoviricetes sp.]
MTSHSTPCIRVRCARTTADITYFQFFFFLYKGAFLMIFDFEKFARITASVYPVSPYTLEEALSVFHYYFEKYEEYTGRPHPPIKASQIVRICQDMPFISREYGSGLYADIDPEAYPVLIDKYFATKYRNCDRNINHFFSGRIRELRFYEELY